MYTVEFKGEGEIRIEKPHNSITIRHYDGEVQVKKSVLYGNRNPEIISLPKYGEVQFEDLDSGTIFNFEGKVPFSVACELV